jgi:outer membrane protein assembly factor BamD
MSATTSGARLDLPRARRYGGAVNRGFAALGFIVVLVLAFPQRAPAPLIYTPGEGWIYEPVGGEGKWRRARAKDQLEVADAAFQQKDYGTALKAARAVVKQWPFSDSAPHAQYLIGRCYEEKKQDERAFQAYTQALKDYPKSITYDEVLQRQYLIANRFLDGQWYKLWGYIPVAPFLTSADKTPGLYQKIVESGPYSEVAPQAQMKIGAAREKEKNYPLAAKAYEVAVDRYSDRPKVAADAYFKAGAAYDKQALKAEYDQGTAGRAISTFNDFITLYPDDPRVTDARKRIGTMKGEQARGAFDIARYYEKRKRWQGALIYYNEVLLLDPSSKYAAEARVHIDELKKRVTAASQ